MQGWGVPSRRWRQVPGCMRSMALEITAVLRVVAAQSVWWFIRRREWAGARQLCGGLVI